MVRFRPRPPSLKAPSVSVGAFFRLDKSWEVMKHQTEMVQEQEQELAECDVGFKLVLHQA